MPEYRISFKLYENGLTRDLEMDYGDFVIKGKLVDLAVFDSRVGRVQALIDGGLCRCGDLEAGRADAGAT